MNAPLAAMLVELAEARRAYDAHIRRVVAAEDAAGGRRNLTALQVAELEAASMPLWRRLDEARRALESYVTLHVPGASSAVAANEAE